MTACFWAGKPLEPADRTDDDLDADDDPRPRCPRCDTPVLVVTCCGPAEHVATPCGCRVPGDLLAPALESEQDGGTDEDADTNTDTDAAE